MSKVSVVNFVQLQVSPETAALVAALLLRVNWAQFPEAEALRDELFDSDAVEDDLEIEFDSDSGEFNRA